MSEKWGPYAINGSYLDIGRILFRNNKKWDKIKKKEDIFRDQSDTSGNVKLW